MSCIACVDVISAYGSTSSHRPSFAAQVDQAVAATSFRAIGSLNAGENAAEDSDSWLEVSPEELDEMLKRSSGRSEGIPVEKQEIGPEEGQALGDLAKKVEAFVGGEGDMEGARFDE